MPGHGSKSKFWCFTLNNYDPEDIAGIEVLVAAGDATYIVFGIEGTGEGQTPHIQGYVEFVNRKPMSSAKSKIGRRAHLELRKGTAQEASTYCKKEEMFQEFGTISTPSQGRRSDLESIREKIKGGATELEIAEAHFGQWCSYRKAFREYKQLLVRATTRDSNPEVFIYYGATGAGKTRRVVEREEDLWFGRSNDLSWFDGYVGQEAALFDDFTGVRPSHFDILLKLTDRYDIDLPYKGGFLPWRPKRVYFTSNLPLDAWYSGVAPESDLAFRRRITEIRKFERNGDSVLEPLPDLQE